MRVYRELRAFAEVLLVPLAKGEDERERVRGIGISPSLRDTSLYKGGKPTNLRLDAVRCLFVCVYRELRSFTKVKLWYNHSEVVLGGEVFAIVESEVLFKS